MSSSGQNQDGPPPPPPPPPTQSTSQPSRKRRRISLSVIDPSLRPQPATTSPDPAPANHPAPQMSAAALDLLHRIRRPDPAAGSGAPGFAAGFAGPAPSALVPAAGPSAPAAPATTTTTTTTTTKTAEQKKHNADRDKSTRADVSPLLKQLFKRVGAANLGAKKPGEEPKPVRQLRMVVGILDALEAEVAALRARAEAAEDEVEELKRRLEEAGRRE
ncbi:hypothetical protein LTS15_004118 [Exophiala xenobiotica]|nr:hypothetical protein LTS15_004118 [Exophiala xenobiotica]